MTLIKGAVKIVNEVKNANNTVVECEKQVNTKEIKQEVTSFVGNVEKLENKYDDVCFFVFAIK